jgi:hypothetical protein
VTVFICGAVACDGFILWGGRSPVTVLCIGAVAFDGFILLGGRL